MKWKLFLPQGEMAKHPKYGYTVEKVHGEIYAIHFNTGAHIFFKTYSQDTESLQSGSCHALFCDEELPMEHYDELMFRLTATEGYFNMVFTATIGQEFWRLAMEPKEGEQEKLPMAYKNCVSMYDCLKYMDGTGTPWDLPKIRAAEMKCKNQNEVLRRVYGRFVKDEGLKYPTFETRRHKKEPHPLPASWLLYAGIDVGSGKGTPNASRPDRSNHPSAIIFVAVSPDYRQARVIDGWRGDDTLTTAGDVFEKYREMVRRKKYNINFAYYDFASKDFHTIGTRAGYTFLIAEKSHEIGENTLNTLFKNDMLFVYDTPELNKLCTELSTLDTKTNKVNAKDDMVDALRYCVAKIPWDWSFLEEDPGSRTLEPLNGAGESMVPSLDPITEARRAAFMEQHAQEEYRIEDEFREFNELCG
jgi:phage terminase large subunit-like protein